MLNCTFNLFLQHVFVVEESGGWIGLPAGWPRSFNNWKHLAHYEIRNMKKKTYGCWVAKILYQIRMGQHSSQNSSSWSSQLPDIYGRVLKENGTLPGGNMALSHILWDVLLPSNSKCTSVFLCQFKYLICFHIFHILYCVVNKIKWVYEICKSFV